MSIETRPLTVYPTFHDTQTNTKSVDTIDTIDSSIYHLLSLYLNTDTIINNTPPQKRKSKISYLSLQQRHNWLGENIHRKQDDILKRNTSQNINIPSHVTNTATKRKKQKSVSFNETVTVIISHDNISKAVLKQQQQQTNATFLDEDIFVDALESFE